MIKLPRSTFYYRPGAVGDGLPHERLAELIIDIQDEFPRYGYRRVTHELRRRGHLVTTSAWPEPCVSMIWASGHAGGL